MCTKTNYIRFCAATLISLVQLMNELGTDRVISFDHVAIADSKVLAVDMKSVSQYTVDGGLEVVVFCLSLMGKNWREYIAEAKRCLCVRGSMLIAQTTRELANGQRLSELREVISQQGVCYRFR
jgi:hypothetical protein